LTSDGPVVLDATISFRAELKDFEGYDPPFYFSWSDDASPTHWYETETESSVSDWNITYASKNKYEEREYQTTVRVYYDNIFGMRDKMAENTIAYKVTKNLNGKLVFKQNGRRNGSDVIKSTQDTELSIQFHDPSHFLDDAVLTFYWFVNDTNYGPSTNNSFHFKFHPPGHYTVETIVMAQKAGEVSEPTPQLVLTNTEEFRSMSSAQLRDKAVAPYMKTGVFRRKLESRTPITNFNKTGETLIKAGQMLELNLTCDGSGPWEICWSITAEVPYNSTGNETCGDYDAITLTDSCSYPVTWFFRESGNHDILAIVDNGVSHAVQVIYADMYNATHSPPISVVVVPISCSLMGIFGMAAGLITFYYCRRKVAVETADFDFNSPEEQLEYKTFWERLRDSMINAFSNSSDDVSHVSSVSSRSIQHPITSIHYGSIS